MTAIQEIQQVLIVDTEFGEAQALFIIDYGVHCNTIWVCASLKDGKVRHFDSNQIRISQNHTMNFNTEKQQRKDGTGKGKKGEKAKREIAQQ